MSTCSLLEYFFLLFYTSYIPQMTIYNLRKIICVVFQYKLPWWHSDVRLIIPLWCITEAPSEPKHWSENRFKSLSYPDRRSSHFQQSRTCSYKLCQDHLSFHRKWRWRGRRRTRPECDLLLAHLRRCENIQQSASHQGVFLSWEHIKDELTCSDAEQKHPDHCSTSLHPLWESVLHFVRLFLIPIFSHLISALWTACDVW